VSIELPYDEPALPPGPHLAEFQVACTTCHSTRLALTQPPFPKAKWHEVVHKMVATYGAPLNAADEAQVVDYLAAIRGK
jgi:transposase-like protein